MKLHISIPPALKTHFEAELQQARETFRNKDLALAWQHLERAHVLGQAWPWQHTKAHWKMLVFAFRIKNSKEIIGQIPRLLVGGVKSFVGEIPVGNTGGANVPPLRTMQIPDDLQKILDQSK